MSEGHFDGTTFVLPVRVYYDDTDAGGVVYHANYLKFGERARTEMLRAVGVEHTGAMAAHGTAFLVRRCQVDWLRPARLDDLLAVSMTITKVGGASLECLQVISRDDTILTKLAVKVACVDAAGKPARLPGDVRGHMERLCNS